jgi:class 3 adenylate cyclase
MRARSRPRAGPGPGHTFLFVDLAGFTALTETHGDETGAALAERFAAAVGDALAGEARLVSTIGDAAFVVAPGPDAALAVLGRLRGRLEVEADFPAVRAGLHHGEAVERGGQLYGTAVNVAARVAAEARAGQVLATEGVAAAARRRGIAVRALGRVALKNVRDLVALFSLDLGMASERERIDPVCRMRVAAGHAAARLTLDDVEHWFCSRECLALFVRDRVGRGPGPG